MAEALPPPLLLTPARTRRFRLHAALTVAAWALTGALFALTRSTTAHSPLALWPLVPALVSLAWLFWHGVELYAPRRRLLLHSGLLLCWCGLFAAVADGAPWLPLPCALAALLWAVHALKVLLSEKQTLRAAVLPSLVLAVFVLAMLLPPFLLR